MHRMKRIKLHDRCFRLMIEADVIDRLEIEITGIGVMAAITPGRCAAIPAPAMITSIPRFCAFLAKDSTSAGVR